MQMYYSCKIMCIIILHVHVHVHAMFLLKSWHEANAQFLKVSTSISCTYSSPRIIILLL